MRRLLAFTQSVRYGGDDTVLIELLRAWPKEDAWTVVLNEDHPGRDVYARALAGRARLVIAPVSAERDAGTLRALRAAAILRAVFGEIRPEIALVSSGGFPPTPLTLAAIIAAKRAGAGRVALALHNEPHFGFGPRAWVRRGRGFLAARLCDCVISVSRDCAAKISASCGRPVSAILNGSDPAVNEDPRALRAELGVPPEAFLIGAIANLEARKGLGVLVKAFARLARPDARLVIIGADAEPEQAALLRAMLAAPALAGRALLAGYRPQARRFAAAFDVCVIPSLYSESFGLLALDAMQAGLPVVATRVGGLPEVVEDGVTGLLVPPSDCAALASALERLLAEPELARRLGAAGRKRAQESFTAARMASEYRSLLVGPAAPAAARNDRVFKS